VLALFVASRAFFLSREFTPFLRTRTAATFRVHDRLLIPLSYPSLEPPKVPPIAAPVAPPRFTVQSRRVNRNFSQTITFRSDQPDQLISLAQEWDAMQASLDIMGYIGVRILADRDAPGRYVMIADFGIVDPDVSAAQEAFINNERAETQEMADR